jgi:ketosteroid isomerase-like protein
VKNAINVLVLGALISLVGLGGCATLGGGASDEELVLGALTAWRDALMNDDVEAALAIYSEDFEGMQGGGKDQTADMLHGASDSGDLADIEFIIEEATIIVDGDTAEAEPVVISADFGEFEMVFILAKEEGTWRFVGQEIIED